MSSCKKFLNVFVGVFITVIAGCLIGLIAAGFAKLSDLRNNLVSLASVNAYVTGIFVAAILLVILLLAGGLCGVAGSIRENSYCLLFYAIISLISSLWFLALAIAALKAPDMYFGGNCTSATYFQQLQDYTQASHSAICTSNCQCYLTSAAQASYTGTNAILLAGYAPNTTQVDATQPIRSQDCSNTAWNNVSSFTAAPTIMAYLEGILSCSDWCNMTSSPLVFYRFSNVSAGIPTGYCYDLISSNVKAYSKTAYIIAFVMFGIAMLAFILGCWLRSDVNNHPQGMVKNDGPSQVQLRSY